MMTSITSALMLFGFKSSNTSGFHSTALSRRHPSHPLVGSVDMAQVRNGKYAVVNPVDTTDILYMSPAQLMTQVRVAQTQQEPLVILMTPTDALKTSVSEVTPESTDLSSSND